MIALRRASTAMALAWALAWSLAWPPASFATEPAKPATTIQKMFDDGVASATAGRHSDAIEHFRGALDALRAEGRIASPDAGLIGARLAPSLEGAAHPHPEGA